MSSLYAIILLSSFRAMHTRNILLIGLCVLHITGATKTVQKLLLLPPSNVTITQGNGGGVDDGQGGPIIVRWDLDHTPESLAPEATGVEITVTQLHTVIVENVHNNTSDSDNINIPEDVGLKTFIIQVSAHDREWRLHRLRAGTTYAVVLTAYKLGAYSNASELVIFTTQPRGDTAPRLYVNALDILIVLSMLAAWMVSFAIFIQKWNKLKIASSHPQFNQPKNLESIQVVESSHDSVIRRNYSTSHNNAMVARQNRLDERTQTENSLTSKLPIKRKQDSNHKKADNKTEQNRLDERTQATNSPKLSSKRKQNPNHKNTDNKTGHHYPRRQDKMASTHAHEVDYAPEVAQRMCLLESIKENHEREDLQGKDLEFSGLRLLMCDAV